MDRRSFLLGALAPALPGAEEPLGFRLTDVTRSSGLEFHHHSGSFGAKYLPETLGPGCAFLDYDNDGWQDILLINGIGWPGQPARNTTLALYKNNRNGTFRDVTQECGLAVPM